MKIYVPSNTIIWPAMKITMQLDSRNTHDDRTIVKDTDDKMILKEYT